MHRGVADQCPEFALQGRLAADANNLERRLFGKRGKGPKEQLAILVTRIATALANQQKVGFGNTVGGAELSDGLGRFGGEDGIDAIMGDPHALGPNCRKHLNQIASRAERERNPGMRGAVPARSSTVTLRPKPLCAHSEKSDRQTRPMPELSNWKNTASTTIRSLVAGGEVSAARFESSRCRKDQTPCGSR